MRPWTFLLILVLIIYHIGQCNSEAEADADPKSNEGGKKKGGSSSEDKKDKKGSKEGKGKEGKDGGGKIKFIGLRLAR